MSHSAAAPRAGILPGIPVPAVFGHRGCSSLAPENTFPSFQLCLENGVHGIEFDIHRCASGDLVVIHDHDLQRLAGVPGVVEDLTYAELSTLDVGSHFSKEFADERIPLLDDLFSRFGNSFFYDVEIKSSRRKDNSGISEALAETIARHKLSERCLVSSFNPFRIREFRRIAPHVATAVIFSAHEDVPKLLRRGFGRTISGCSCLKPHSPLVSEAMLKKLSHYPVLPWTVNSIDEAERVVNLGCAGIITDRPQDFTKYTG